MDSLKPSTPRTDLPEARSTAREERPAGIQQAPPAPRDSFSPKEVSKVGLVLLQIDGLSHKALKEALKNGSAPNIKRTLDAMGYALSPFQCGIATVTLPVLASLFYGVELPGNDWFDKSTGQFVDGSVYETQLRKDLAAEGKEGILSKGVVFSSPLSGGSSETSLTVNTLKENREKKGALRTLVGEAVKDLKILKRGGYSLTKTAWHFIADIFKARAWMKREGVSRTKLDKLAPIMMSLNHNIMEKVAGVGLVEAVKRGVPSMYVDFAAYDEKAHYFGPTSKEAMEMLKTIDDQIGKVTRAAEASPQKYEVLIFSDHGQTPSKLFSDVYGKKVGDMTADFARFTRESRGETYDEKEIVFTDAYSLGNIYFNFEKGRVSLDDVEKRYPQLLDFLTDHPGIGLVCGTGNGKVIIRGKVGTLEVDGEKNLTLKGANPLTAYGDEKVLLNQILNYMSVKGSGDVVIFGAYDKDKDEVIDFNKKYSLKSLHGGLGGDQTRPFIIAKPEVPVNGQEITEATQLHDLHQKYRKYLKG
jgi:hypothetical protein